MVILTDQMSLKTNGDFHTGDVRVFSEGFQQHDWREVVTKDEDSI